MITEIKRPVKVEAVFHRNKIKVLWLKWNGKKIYIDRITFSWASKKGNKVIYHFALAGGEEIFEVVFIPVDLSWQLEKIHTH
jgi:hypothetical protein